MATIGRPAINPETRFYLYIKKTSDGCWNWQNRIAAGYGQFWIGKKIYGAHRWAYEYFTGRKIPDGFQVDHLCKNKICVNPQHLEATTPQVNTLRSNNPASQNAKKTHCLRGHELSPENTYIRKDRTGRYCRKCINIRQSRRVLSQL